jgi:hypothetical protein
MGEMSQLPDSECEVLSHALISPILRPISPFKNGGDSMIARPVSFGQKTDFLLRSLVGGIGNFH